MPLFNQFKEQSNSRLAHHLNQAMFMKTVICSHIKVSQTGFTLIIYICIVWQICDELGSEQAQQD